MPHNRQNLLFEPKQINQHPLEEYNRTQNFHNKAITISRIQPQLTWTCEESIKYKQISEDKIINGDWSWGDPNVRLADKNFKVDVMTG